MCGDYGCFSPHEDDSAFLLLIYNREEVEGNKKTSELLGSLAFAFQLRESFAA